MCQSQAKPIQKYNPSKDEMEDVTQDDYDIRDFKMNITYRIMKIFDLNKLKEITQLLNKLQ